jgi:hypothetical protein
MRLALSRRRRKIRALLEITLVGNETKPIEAKLVGDLTSPQIGIGELAGVSPNFIF